MMSEPITDYTAGAAGLVSWQLQGKANFMALLAVATDRLQLLEDLLQDLGAHRDVDTAEGVQLDRLGHELGQDRYGGPYGLGEADDVYRGKVRARIVANVSCSSAADLARVVRALLGSKVLVVSHTDLPPARFVLGVGVTSGLSAAEEAGLVQMVDDARAAGVGMSLCWYTDKVFGFAEDTDPLVAGFDDGSGTVGGTWAHYFYP